MGHRIAALLLVLFGSHSAIGAPLPPDYQLPPPPGPYFSGSGPTFSHAERLIVTTYFYWYDRASGAHFVNEDGSSSLTDHPPAHELTDEFSYGNPQWHAEQLKDMAQNGVDVALPVYWGTPEADGPSPWSDLGLKALVEGRHSLLAAGETPPRIGMFYDTTSLAFNTGRYEIDLTTPAGQRWFFGTIRNFFSLIPPADRATVEGKPVVFLYSSQYAAAVDDKLFAAVNSEFLKAFGTELYIVKRTDWPGSAAKAYEWGGSVSPRLVNSVAALKESPEAALLMQQIHLDEDIRGARLGLLASDAYYRQYGSDAAFVAAVGWDLLGRSLKPEETARFLGSLQKNGRLQFVDGLSQLDEARRVLVASWYKFFLERRESVQTLQATAMIAPYAELLAAGTPEADVLAAILASDLFFERSGRNDWNDIRRLYRKILGREPDPVGQRHHLQLMAKSGRGAVITSLLTSDESRLTFAARWLRQYMGADGVAAIGPGYNEAAVPGRDYGTIVDRDGGKHFLDGCAAVLAEFPLPKLVHIETWNEYHEGTEVQETQEYGALYLHLLQDFTQSYH